MDSNDIQHRLEFTLDASERAEAIVMKYFLDAKLQVQLKGDRSPVTVADRGAEEFLRGKIAQEFPDDAILGEEFGEQPGTSGYRWILDPIDGTKSFIHGVPLFGMLIGLQFEETCVAGICRIPALNEVVYARRGGGAWWQRGDDSPVRAQVRSQDSMENSLFLFTAVEGFQEIDRMDALEKFSSASGLSRSWGDCYGHMLVATGRADFMVDPLLAEWDAAALIPIVEEAGGVFMTWAGESTATGGNGISTTPALRDEILKICNG
ncbi:Histidinol-phosphatase [Thalassoglobus neptunius]|uniref:Histidinol-phosphatase n=1 Tax=Thalassoglobus neptunius TaxID=1938619 RepID=A0A5C5X7U9_9PLAN|nr:inositol monophosphatase family protein [Thalassoglobus neptunius]TWT58421.1 Histidinol-phosphatase [Thalassoglobus neptunius]